MKLSNHDEIVQAIQDLHEALVTWPSQDNGGALQTRRCAPMDFALSRRFRDQIPRYHFWDFESDSGPSHNLSLLASQITRVEVLTSTFDPTTFVNWDTQKSRWQVARTSWGAFN